MALSPDDALTQARKHVLSTIVGRDGQGVLLEPEPASRAYQVTETSRPGALSNGPLAFAANCRLVRWLRVNGECLSIPDSVGVFDDLSEQEQALLRQSGVQACIPLVRERRLIGFVATSGFDVRAYQLTIRPRLNDLARRLRDAQGQWDEARQSESIARSNRLSVAGQLAASVAHEIRNPLAAIRSTVQMLRDDDVPVPARPQLLSTVMDEVDRVNRTLVDMLALGRLRSSAFETCDIDRVVDQAVAFCQGYAERRQTRISRRGYAKAVKGDPYELRQVVVNLLLNACQASKAGCTIHIETANQPIVDDRLGVVIRVVDEGIGIAAQDLAHVFEPFFTTKVDGGGLGLGICRDTVGRHGGRMELTSQVSVGTTVSVYLPGA